MIKEAKDFPKLYALASTGKVKEWGVKVVPKGKTGAATIQITHGYVDGKKQTTKRNIAKGKNIGRSNETTPWDQACAEAQSLWNKKHDKKYQETIPTEDTPNDLLLPMLAHDFKKRGKNIIWPAFVQPKLNGIRCLATVTSDGVEFTSRKGKPFHVLQHLTEPIREQFHEGDVLDGELFTPDLTFQEITRAVKREKAAHETTDKIQYWLYDMAIPELSFLERNRRLCRKFITKPTFDLKPAEGVGQVSRGPLVCVDTLLCREVETLDKWHQLFVQQSFEGTIIRNIASYYKFDFRSTDLQKYKDFIDAEFTIVGGHEGTGKDAGTVIFECETAGKSVFSVRPRGSQEKRKEWWNSLDKIVGKNLTVRFQSYSDDQIPIFPVGLAIRDYE